MAVMDGDVQKKKDYKYVNPVLIDGYAVQKFSLVCNGVQ